MKGKIIYNQCSYLSKKINLERISNKLVNDGNANMYLFSDGKICIKNNDRLIKNKLKIIFNQREIKMLIRNLDDIKSFLNDNNKETFQILTNNLNTEHNLGFRVPRNVAINLNPLFLMIGKDKYRLDTIVKIYDDGYVLFSYILNFECTQEEDIIHFKDYLFKSFVVCNDYMYKNIYEVFNNIFIHIFGNKKLLSCARYTYMFNCNSLSDNTINMLLDGVNISPKECINYKDYRPYGDYCHFSNEIVNVIYGDNIFNNISSPNQSKEEYILYRVVKSKNDLDMILNGKCSNKKLVNLKKEYNKFNYRLYDSVFGEVDDYIKEMYDKIGNNDIINHIMNEIDYRLDNNKLIFENILAVFSIILSSNVIIEYVIMPSLNLYIDYFNISFNYFYYDKTILYFWLNFILIVIFILIKNKKR